ncbi:DUF3368 domain-containing protein [Halorubrum sp. Ea8]|nr:DUF3368 domain-containing protein [Halorubrum sp. Ea8]
MKRGRLSAKNGREPIDATIDHGWYVSPDPYAEIVRKRESVE